MRFVVDSVDEACVVLVVLVECVGVSWLDPRPWRRQRLTCTPLCPHCSTTAGQPVNKHKGRQGQGLQNTVLAVHMLPTRICRELVLHQFGASDAYVCARQHIHSGSTSSTSTPPAALRLRLRLMPPGSPSSDSTDTNPTPAAGPVAAAAGPVVVSVAALGAARAAASCVLRSAASSNSRVTSCSSSSSSSVSTGK